MWCSIWIQGGRRALDAGFDDCCLVFGFGDAMVM